MTDGPQTPNHGPVGLPSMETRADILPPFGNFPLTERRKLEFIYDGQGRRVAKKVSNWAGSGWQLASFTLFLYDGWNLLADVNALTNTSACTYVWGLDLSGSMQGAGGVGGLLFSTYNSALGSHAAGYDGNGNLTSFVSMATGQKSANYEYSTFGETLISEGVIAVANPFRFSSKYTDTESGLLYYGLRYYSPSVGRWISRDPIEESGGLNFYGFVDNNPLEKVDVVGLAARPVRKFSFSSGMKLPDETIPLGVVTIQVGGYFEVNFEGQAVPVCCGGDNQVAEEKEGEFYFSGGLRGAATLGSARTVKKAGSELSYWVGLQARGETIAKGGAHVKWGGCSGKNSFDISFQISPIKIRGSGGGEVTIQTKYYSAVFGATAYLEVTTGAAVLTFYGCDENGCHGVDVKPEGGFKGVWGWNASWGGGIGQEYTIWGK